MAEIKDSQLIRDALGSPVPQYWDETSKMYIARTVDGSFADVDFSKVRLLRDKLGSPIPQLWDIETAKFVPGKGGSNGEVTIESVPGLRSELDQTNATLAETEMAVESNIRDSFSYRLANPKVDRLGMKSVNIAGDSIGHGANAPKIYEDSWVAIVRNSLKITSGTDNYGFITMMNQISNAVGQYADMLYISSAWTGANATDVPGFYKRTSSTAGQKISGWLQDKTFNINKLGIGVVKHPGGGDIIVRVKAYAGGEIQATGTYSLNAATTSNEIIWLDTTAVTDFHVIEIEQVSGTNTVFGYYLLENENQVVLNNYSRSGAKIADLGDALIEDLFNTNVLIFALGHNDSPTTIDSYLAKCKVAYDKYKPLLYVVDLTWTDARKATGDKLKQFAKDCGGTYIEIIKRVADANDLIASGFLSDVSHPTPTIGHKTIAEKVLAVVKAPIASKEFIGVYKSETNGGTQVMTILPLAGYTLTSGAWAKDGNYNTVTLDIAGSSFASGSALCTLDKPSTPFNNIGSILKTGGVVVQVPFTLNNNSQIVIYPSASADLTGATRFIANFSYLN